MSGAAPLGWAGIARLGLVQAAIGAITMLATSLLNRVMVVEFALPAAVPAGLVAWHYAVQLSRPVWGHGSDRGGDRSAWIMGGMALLGLGALLAVNAVPLFDGQAARAGLMAVVAFAMIGGGVGASGTSLLALLAARVAPERRQAAAAITWTMMIAGIAGTAGVAGALLEPFSLVRLANVSAGVVAGALLVTALALRGIERAGMAAPSAARPAEGFGAAVRATLADPAARRFTLFVFCSMLAYSMQDLILEPFAGLLFGLTPGASTGLSGVQHGGALAGMLLAGVAGQAFRGMPARGWIVGGCGASALALAGLVLAARFAPDWPLAANVAALGFANGVFAVSAIGAMMALAGAGGGGREGVRLGVWGAAQAIAFGSGGLVGAVAVDAARAAGESARDAYMLVFAAEAGLFLLAALLALAVTARPVAARLRPVGAVA